MYKPRKAARARHPQCTQAVRMSTRRQVARACAPAAERRAGAAVSSADQNVRVWHRVRAPFLFPPRFAGHACEWEPLSYTQAGCLLCGTEHRCSTDNPDCKWVHHEEGHVVCEITGCVLRETVPQDEWAANERACVERESVARGQRKRDRRRASRATTEHRQQDTHTPATLPADGEHAQAGHSGDRTSPHDDPCTTWNFVNSIVKLILQSPQSKNCIYAEVERLCLAQTQALQKELRRQLAEVQHVNMVTAAAAVSWQTRKLRRPIILDEDSMATLVRMCTDAVTHVVLRYGVRNSPKMLHNETRRREFACSMLYLIRSGVECRGQCILPRIDVMHRVLPLETCLPDVFGIRSKSITEGENLLKLEIRRARHGPAPPPQGRLGRTS